MSDEDIQDVQVQEEQRKASKRATLDLFQNKKRAQQEFTFTVDGDDYTFLFRAVSAKEWDKLVTSYPPTKDQKLENFSYNPDQFGPALLSRVCIDPEMTVDDWSKIWESPDWSKGELQELFWSAVGLCNRGLDVNPTGPASA